jgi:hypothetical protein
MAVRRSIHTTVPTLRVRYARSLAALALRARVTHDARACVRFADSVNSESSFGAK